MLSLAERERLRANRWNVLLSEDEELRRQAQASMNMSNRQRVTRAPELDRYMRVIDFDFRRGVSDDIEEILRQMRVFSARGYSPQGDRSIRRVSDAIADYIIRRPR
jgi:hypothetical protein